MTRNLFAFLLVLFCQVFSLNGICQQEDGWFKEGQKILDQTGDFSRAREFFIKSAETDTANIKSNEMAGIACLESSNRYQAVKFLNRVLQLDSSYRPDIKYLIGMSLQSGYQFKEATTNFQSYRNKLQEIGEVKEFPSLKDVNKRLEECQWGEYYIQHPKPVEITNLGKNINSPYPDYAPVIDQSESVLIFTSRRENDNLSNQMENGEYYEDVYASVKTDNRWGPPVNAGKPINTPFHDSDIALSADGTKLFLYKDLNEGDIYVSELHSEGWSEPVSLKVLNSPYTEKSMTLSSNGKMMIFSSNRPEGFGGFDLYRITFNGQFWSKPENLGPEINTEYDEDSPFIDYNDSILFFSSKGWDAMGGFDIFRKNIYDQNKPQNLGYPVNTPEDDIYFIATRDKDRAYFASLRSEGYGDLDIYMLKNLSGSFTKFQRQEIQVGSKRKKIDSVFSNLQPVYFEFGKTVLLSGSDSIINSNVRYLKNHPEDKVMLSGHTDNIGSDEENVVLSMERAMKVAILLKQQGIPEARIKLEAKGECCPVVSNDNETERSKNRRVEFLIINK